MNEQPTYERCNLCWGRGYKPEVRKSGRGLYLRTCPRCGGIGSVEPGTRNPDNAGKRKA